MRERKLKLEIWIDLGENGEHLPSLLYAGPRGEPARQQLLGPNARHLLSFRAHCHFEAMTKYYEMMAWGKYTTDQECDYEPYPEEWIDEQEHVWRCSSGDGI